MLLVRAIIFLLGAFVVIRTVLSAISTFVIPRGETVYLTRMVFLTVRFFYRLRTNRAETYSARDRIMASYAAISLLALPPVWLTIIVAGYTGMFWALGAPTWTESFRLSGSALLTLGFASADGVPATILMFSEALIGLGLIALLISYLPTMYSAFQRREALVTMLQVRAGAPPSVVEMIARYHRIHGLDRLTDVWKRWEEWFADVEESHTSLAPLVFFRSPDPNRSWITAAGAVLDSASFAASTLDISHDPSADLCIRAGYLALRHIAGLFRIPSDPNPKPTDPISVSRQEYDAVYDDLAGRGVPLKPDREQAWCDFAGWRVNYDTVLLALANLTMAPYAPWSSDRSLIGTKDSRIWHLRA
ncbi:MAG TPA: hypothetical protein VF932_13375 [Anaerolineae bacterium]